MSIFRANKNDSTSMRILVFLEFPRLITSLQKTKKKVAHINLVGWNAEV